MRILKTFQLKLMITTIHHLSNILVTLESLDVPLITVDQYFVATKILEGYLFSALKIQPIFMTQHFFYMLITV
jgi:hypothetical protein